MSSEALERQRPIGGKALLEDMRYQDIDIDLFHTAFTRSAIGPLRTTVQDQALINGKNTLELNSLADWGITAIDYANNRYEFDTGLRSSGVANGQIAYQNIKTLTLVAKNEGTRYTRWVASDRVWEKAA